MALMPAPATATDPALCRAWAPTVRRAAWAGRCCRRRNPARGTSCALQRSKQGSSGAAGAALTLTAVAMAMAAPAVAVAVVGRRGGGLSGCHQVQLPFQLLHTHPTCNKVIY